ncbi:MAG: pyridoxal phosphate-dependent aminotransferase [Phycisphaerales bacterium]|nr:pyridoxal phosphate-dependent aminotransferase [Phycisphaerales bacterium]
MTGIAEPMSAFRQLPFMGVIRVNEEAMKIGYRMGDPNWSNLGQGQPEIGVLEGAPPRYDNLTIDLNDHGYGPVEGLPELRQAVADHYNRLYRAGKSSQYTMENVAIAAGGRLALSRCGATMADIRLGYFTPDYTAYEDLLTTFDHLDPEWIELTADTAFRIDPGELEARVERDGVGALLISNPCNPTGVVIHGEDLDAWVQMSRRRNCTLLMDEFYSHYVYGSAFDCPVSSAAYIEDVNEDPVVIFDGLTKCFRYPGWRVGWVLAPRGVIRSLTAAGSFLDGGPCRPIQRAAIEVLKPQRADQETQAVRREFTIKQRLTIDSLTKLGIEFPGKPEGTFYAWGSVQNLPAPLSDGIGFMREAFKHRVLTVPGEYFDVNPHRRRTGRSPLSGFVRFSFGPPRANLQAGLDRLGEMLSKR